jgi:hypothetical protein
MFAPCLLACTDPAIRGLSKTAIRRQIRGHAPASRAVSHGRRRSGLTRAAAPDSLDQWSRPSMRAPETRPDSPMPMLSRSVRPAGNRHSYRGYVAGTGAPGRPVTCQRCTGATRFPGGGSRALRGRQRAPEIDVPGKLGRGQPQPGRTPGDDGNGDTGNGRAHTGAVCARDGPRPGTAGHGLPGRPRRGAFADTGSGQRRAVAEGSAGTVLGNSGCGPLQASPVPGETVAGAL